VVIHYEEALYQVYRPLPLPSRSLKGETSWVSSDVATSKYPDTYLYLYRLPSFTCGMQGTPSGEAFIQMDSEKSAESTALTKNRKLMFVGGTRRYVEVIQCSGDEMALVLQQGLPAPAWPVAALPSVPPSSASVHAAAAAMLPTAGFWSLPPPSAPAATTTDISLLLQHRTTIPLAAAPGQLSMSLSMSLCLSLCRPAPFPFPGRMSYKVTKPGSVCPVSWPRFFSSVSVVLLTSTTFCVVLFVYSVLLG